MSTTQRALDTQELEQRVKDMYREVAEEPSNEFHFETGRQLAERLGYPSDELDAIPAPSIDSFAGVGYYFDLAAIAAGETVVDLGSGSGTDSFLAANQTGSDGICPRSRSGRASCCRQRMPGCVARYARDRSALPLEASTLKGPFAPGAWPEGARHATAVAGRPTPKSCHSATLLASGQASIATRPMFSSLARLAPSRA